MNYTTDSQVLLSNKSQVPKEFNKIARRYDIATSFSQGYSSDLDLSVKRMNLKRDEKLADLCCGTGKSTISCLKALPNGFVMAVDFSDEMLKMAQQRLAEQYPAERLSFLLKDVMELDFPDNSYDAIFMAYGIRNMPDYDRCLQNLLRILKPGGIIAFHEYSISDSFFSKIYWYVLGYLLIIPFSALLTGSVTIFRYLIKSVANFPSPDKFKNILQNNGFTDIKSLPLKSWRHPILHTFLAKKPGTRSK
jgi:ubiquinone/menaquinone biosynthesis methyltransferase